MATFFPLTESVVIVKKFVLDADTFQFKYNKMIRTRAGFIDTPELKYKDDPSQEPQDLNQWEWGVYTKTFFLSLTHRKNICVIPHGGLDLFGRAVADWYLCDRLEDISIENNLQHILVSEGLAVIVPPNHPSILYQSLKNAQNKAQSNRSGFWNDDEFVLPYIWKATR